MEEEEIVLLSDEELANAFVGDAYSLYMKEVFSFRLLSGDENKELARRYRNGDLYALELLINHNLRLVVNIAHKFKRRINHLHLLDIIQEGNIGLMRAAQDYDPDVAAFSTYANWWIKQAIGRAINDKEEEIRKPVHIHDLSNKYLTLTAENKGLSDDEVCEILDIAKETLDNVKRSLNISSVSMNQTIDDDEKSELGDFLSKDFNDYDDVLEAMSNNRLFLAIKEVLTDLEYYVLYYRILSEERITLEMIAEDFCITRERIRQIEEKAKKKVKPLMQSDEKMKKVLSLLIERENNRLEHLRTKPLMPNDKIKYFFVRDSLSLEQRKLLQYIYFSRYDYDNYELAEKMGMSINEFNKFYDELMIILKDKFKNNDRFDRFKKSMKKNYGTSIFSLDIASDIKIIDYDMLREKYSEMSLDQILGLLDMVDHQITSDEMELLRNYFMVPIRTFYNTDLILRDLNLTIFGFKGHSVMVPVKKLYDVYKKNIEDYSLEQRLFLECYIFNTRDKSEFQTTYKDSSLYYRYYYLIDRLERTYYNIYRFLDNNFTKVEYIKFRKKYKDKFAPLRIELLDLFYGFDGKSYTIPEIAEMYQMDYLKMHDLISDAREAAILNYSGFTQRVEIDKKLYVPYVLNECYSFVPETRKIMKMFLVDNADYDEIASVTGLSKYRISNIVTDAIRKIDNYRFGISDVLMIKRKELEDIFKAYKSSFDKVEKEILRLKHLEHMENSDIAEKLGLELLVVNRCSSHFNKIYYSYKCEEVEITEAEIIDEIGKHPSENVLDDRKRMVTSYFYGVKNSYNPDGVRLSRDELVEKFGFTKTICYHILHGIVSDVKGKKIGLNRAPNSYISRDRLDELLDDYHLPISDKEREIICYLFELKGYPYKTLNDLPEIFGDNKASINRRYQRAIVSIYKYLNNEIEGKISYEVDVLPQLKYFSYSERRILDMYYRDGMTVDTIAKEFNVSFDKMFSTIERLRVNLVDILNNPKAKKFDYDYYMKVRNSEDLPFFGDRDKAIEIFDLFYGMHEDKLRIGIPEIRRTLGLSLENSSVNRAANSLMLSVCKHKEGIRAGNTFSYEEIRKYYDEHASEMKSTHEVYYKRYLDRMEKTDRLNGLVPNISFAILYDLLKSTNPQVYNYDNLDRDNVIKLLKKYGSELNRRVRKELMAIYEISPREFMNGKDINHVYKIFYTLDELLYEKGINIQTKKKD